MWLVLAALGLFALGIAAGAAWVYVALERPALEAANERIQRYEQDLAAMRGRLDESLNALAALEGRFLVEESTRRGLETSLRTAQAELGRAQDTVAFYEQLMPPGPGGAVSVRALDVERAGPHIRYRLLLMRSGSNDKPFQGALQFRAVGRLNGKETSVELQPITVPDAGAVPAAKPSESAARPGAESATESVAEPAAPPGAAPVAEPVADSSTANAGPLSLEFTEFQRSSGVLGLPPGFEPKSVTVNVLEGRTLRVSRSVELPAPQ